MRKMSLIIILIILGVTSPFYCEQEQESKPLSCQYSSDCNDGNVCTIDTCQGGFCTYKKLKPECCASDKECQNNQYCDANGECVCRADGCGDPCGDCPKNSFCKDWRCVGCEKPCGECQKCDPVKGCVNLPKAWKITDSFSFGDDTSSHNYHATNCVEVSSEKQCPNSQGIIFNAYDCDCWVELDLAVSKKAEQLKIGVKLGKDFTFNYGACRVFLNDIDSSDHSVFSVNSSCDLIENVINLNTDGKNAIKDGLVNLSICCYSHQNNHLWNSLSYIQVQSLTCEE